VLSDTSGQDPARNQPNALSEPLEKATSTISEAGNPINLMDSVSSFLKYLEMFNSIVDAIAEV